MALLARLTAAGIPVRCLVRDPRRLGVHRVRVQIALGDLGDPLSFRHALRGVDTVVHLASVIRDQPHGSIEELAGAATWRLVRAAESAGVNRFVFFSALGASTHSRARLLRAKAIAERAVIESSLAHTIFAPSIVYAPKDPYLRLLGPDRVRNLGRGRATGGVIDLAARSGRRTAPRRQARADARGAGPRSHVAPSSGIRAGQKEATGARRSAQGSAASSSEASPSRTSSRAGGPISCTAVGRPSSPW